MTKTPTSTTPKLLKQPCGCLRDFWKLSSDACLEAGKVVASRPGRFEARLILASRQSGWKVGELKPQSQT